MARRLIKRSLTEKTRVDELIERVHMELSRGGTMYSVHEFNYTLAELIVAECANLTRMQMLSFMTEPDAYTGKVFLEETIYDHFSMEKKQ
jgi:CYTH domain-containing protein